MRKNLRGKMALRRYLQDGPRAVTWHVAELKETAPSSPPYQHIVTTVSPELRLYKRGGSVTERRRRSLHGRLPGGTPCPRIRFAYSLRQPRVVYHLPTPLILTIGRATSCRLLEYIRSAATVPRPVTNRNCNTEGRVRYIYSRYLFYLGPSY